ncbi:FecR family protein [Allosphingosinicella deserti]|uniref:Iron dicitrate transport regulator FecR n=1 Tax=Allosphingosinicella deserti TaxID=2116704 RepID=A0A2P7QM93_9SPHN|nr:FecR family protein [Sphingomonas deserti]PSJ39080.1 iron dicitrate transport regulator FecR [Sphingomonas deserti]
MVSAARRTPDGEPPRADAEAAVWIARLNSDARSATTDDALRAWLQADPEHEAAFERATEIWAMIPGAARLNEAEAPRAIPRPNMRQQHWGMALAASLLIAAGAGGWWLSDPTIDYSTEIGEQRVATLKDGSRIALNTGTELHVAFDDKVRRVTLDRGEAMFEVAPNPDRPFVVTAGDRTVRAVGTAFIVRRSGSSVVVTLIEGKVAVAPLRETPEGAEAPALLTAGERLIATAEAPPLIDQPSMEAATAWRRGQAVFNDTPLANAVAELNRYGGPRIAIGDPRLASLRVSGVFATNDTAEFASAIAALHGLRVQHGQSELRIVR